VCLLQGNTYVMECVDEGLLDGPVIYNSYNTRGKYENVRFVSSLTNFLFAFLHNDNGLIL